MKSLRWIALVAMAIVALGVAGSQARTVVEDSLDYSCLQASLLVGHPLIPDATLSVGETELCGYGLRVNNIYGPSMQAWIDSLRDENAALRERVRQLEKGVE